MKKNVLILTIAAILLLATVAMANSSLVLEPIVKPQEVFSPSFDRLASYIGYDTDEKFEIFHSVALFMGKYCTTEESFSFIEQMILSGCDAQTTFDIYQFYLTTNEPISIVKQIYDMVYYGEPITNRDAVFESAFNEITNNKCGVLTEEDIANYLEKGLTINDIIHANLLCRKGVMTIQEILDALLSGTSWETIIERVSGEKITLSATMDVSAATYAMSVAAVTDKSVNTALSKENTDEYFSNKTKEINTQLKEKGYWKGKKSENFEKIAKEAKKKGISEDKLTNLLDEGCNEVDLINVISSPDCTPQTIDSITRKEVLKK